MRTGPSTTGHVIRYTELKALGLILVAIPRSAPDCRYRAKHSQIVGSTVPVVPLGHQSDLVIPVRGGGKDHNIFACIDDALFCFGGHRYSAALVEYDLGIEVQDAHCSIRERLIAVGSEPRAMTADEFGKFIAGEIAKWRKVIEFAAIKVQ